jgi:hypothetical protein
MSYATAMAVTAIVILVLTAIIAAAGREKRGIAFVA